MTRRRLYRTTLIAVSLALASLLITQVYWFFSAYNIAGKQFDENVSIALRDVAHRYLILAGDSTTRIAPVKQIASNSFEVNFPTAIAYYELDSLLRKIFVQHQLIVPFELSVYEQLSGLIAFGNFYGKGPTSSGEPTCLGRTVNGNAQVSMVITFPDKKTDIVSGMGMWIFSGSTFFLILILMSFVIFDLSRQKKIAMLKADFVNNITHELQTPISNISIASEVLSKSGNRLSEEKLQHYAGIISAENQRLKMHVEQVLQTAMMDGGQLNLDRREVNINTIICEVLESFTVRVKNRAGKLISDLNAIHPMIIGDPYHLRNIFFSLLDNAEKYSPNDVRITVTTTNRGSGVVITITDNGVGISQEYQPFIFDKFFRVPQGNLHDTKGFGLGLSYVNRMVTAHHGKVSVRSECNKGSSFEVYFSTAGQ
ncbi:MAG: HAMP domain-containing sensor histidine kinase [Chryseolinea sp.]